jgi:hypothetical protein
VLTYLRPYNETARIGGRSSTGGEAYTASSVEAVAFADRRPAHKMLLARAR